jgi:hypothetical protein
MDPNAALHAIRVELASHAEHGDADVNVLVEHVQALDECLSSGGVKPDAWTDDQSHASVAAIEAAFDAGARTRPNGLHDRVAQLEDRVAQIQRELDAHPNWRQS